MMRVARALGRARGALYPRPATLSAVPQEESVATLIDGTAVANEVRAEVKRGVEDMVAEYGHAPGLGIVLVGDRKDSAAYVRMKKKQAREAGFQSVDILLGENATQAAVIDAVRMLNENETVHGILVQLPSVVRRPWVCGRVCGASEGERESASGLRRRARRRRPATCDLRPPP